MDLQKIFEKLNIKFQRNIEKGKTSLVTDLSKIDLFELAIEVRSLDKNRKREIRRLGKYFEQFEGLKEVNSTLYKESLEPDELLIYRDAFLYNNLLHFVTITEIFGNMKSSVGPLAVLSTLLDEHEVKKIRNSVAHFCVDIDYNNQNYVFILKDNKSKNIVKPIMDIELLLSCLFIIGIFMYKSLTSDLPIPLPVKLKSPQIDCLSKKHLLENPWDIDPV